MRFYYLILGISICASWVSCNSKNEKENSLNDHSDEFVYDSTQARAWGADEYGMKLYVLVLLKRGPNRSPDSTTRARLQAAHMANINRLANEGKLILAGPMSLDEDIRGIYLFNVPDLEEAKKLTESDPAIQAGSLIMEMHPWYGSAALMDIPKLHKRGAKIEI